MGSNIAKQQTKAAEKKRMEIERKEKSKGFLCSSGIEQCSSVSGGAIQKKDAKIKRR
jgi:hypothetical protein